MGIKSTVWTTILCMLLVGCGNGDSEMPGSAPVPPVAVNARLADRMLSWQGAAARGNTVVVGRCVSSEEYAKTTRGDWEDHWMLVRVQVLAIEKGTWTRRHDGGEATSQSLSMFDDLIFIARDTWPTPESGIMMDKGPWPYRINDTCAFMLDTTTTPALIVSQEPRRLIDPISPFKLMKQPFAYRPTLTAARDYLAAHGFNVKRAALDPIDVTDGAIIVVSRADPNAPIMAVSRADYSVRPVPLPQP